MRGTRAKIVRKLAVDFMEGHPEIKKGLFKNLYRGMKKMWIRRIR